MGFGRFTAGIPPATSASLNRLRETGRGYGGGGGISGPAAWSDSDRGGCAVTRFRSTVESKERKLAVRSGGHSCCGGGTAAWQGPHSSTVESNAKMRPMAKLRRPKQLDKYNVLSNQICTEISDGAEGALPPELQPSDTSKMEVPGVRGFTRFGDFQEHPSKHQ